jgi:large subunit ribosomal protein L22
MAVETKEYRAEARFQRVSPQKARLVLDLIKGRGVEEALTTAAFTKKRIAPVIYKLLTSAVDNAKYVSGEQGLDLDVDNLYVKTALANDGPRMKRIRPAPMGRAFRYQRRLTHIVLSVAERASDESLVTKVEEPAAAKAVPAAKAMVEEPETAPKKAKAAKKAEEPETTAKAKKSKAEEPETAAKAKATKKKAEEPETAAKATKQKAGK